MNELVVAASDVAKLRANLIGQGTELCAILFTIEVRVDDRVRSLVRKVQFPEASDYTISRPLEAELRPDFVARITKSARHDGTGLVFVHSHPGAEPPSFSDIDRFGEERLKAFLSHRHDGATHAALVISEGGMRARELGGGPELRILSLGSTRDILFEPEADRDQVSELFDRQVRLIGEKNQTTLGSLRVAIVGLGGTGSLISQQLAHLGVRKFTLIDADIIEVTNLNRVTNATTHDIGRPKVDVAARYIDTFAANASVQRVKGDLMRTDVARQLLSSDLIFGCTDSHGSRAVLQQVSYQYLIPCIDMGVVIAARDGHVSHVYGRVQLLSPGQACLICGGLLDPNQVRQDMMTAYERQADPYFPGAQDPAPAVISLNGTIASLAVTMMLSVVAGFPSAARHLLYNAVKSSLRSVYFAPQEDCYICSRIGSFARGESWPLFARSA